MTFSHPGQVDIGIEADPSQPSVTPALEQAPGGALRPLRGQGREDQVVLHTASTQRPQDPVNVGIPWYRHDGQRLEARGYDT